MSQDILTLVLIMIALIACTAWISSLIYSGRLRAFEKKNQQYLLQNQGLTSSLESLNRKMEQVRGEHRMNEMNLVKTTTELHSLQKRWEEHQDDEDIQLQKFENLATRVLQQEGDRFNRKQSADMKQILGPLKERIKEFELKVERTHHESIKRDQSLKEHINILGERSQQVSQDAQKLAKALSADFKQQGNWGELILESILDKSGLEKGREYHIQTTLKDEEGNTFRPDVIINLPDGKSLIIDSKVSLNAYSALVNAEENEEAKLWQIKHAKAIKRHIEDLASKNYQGMVGGSSPDFVLMFIPIDTAFTSALIQDPELYQYGFDNNIIVVTSSTLLATLKTVETMWRNDKQNKNAQKIAEEAGKMYDKLVGFSKTMNQLGMQINTVKNSYDLALNKLQTGRGNLIKRAQDIKKMGAKTSKKLEGVLLDVFEEE